MSLTDLRRDYTRARLDEGDVLPDPIAQFRRWLQEAEHAEVAQANAMTLATASADGAPSARVVLLKALDERGFVFFTDFRSRKGEDLASNPRAALVFFWEPLERQVRICGSAHPVPAAEADEYYRSRPVGSRLGAWASHQSMVIPGREWLDARLRDAEERFADADPPRPVYWSGFRIAPQRIEFWQGRPNRLHDRLEYVRDNGGWRIQRLAP